MRASLLGLVSLAALASVALLGSAVSPAHAQLGPNFFYGAATAAYQIEGSWDVDRKQPSEWDLFSHLPGKVANGDNGDVADRGYEFALDDVALLSSLGVNSYRFSLSWGRIIDADGNVNPRGVKHYSDLIDALLAAQITPFVTMYHWDLPLQYGTMMGDDGRGWLNSTYIVPLYLTYATAVFDAFADRVKHWIVFNEPHSFCVQGFATGNLAPGRCSDRSWCDAGDSSTEPYTCAHSVILAFSAVANLYRSVYQPNPKYGPAQLGMSLDASMAMPWTNSQADADAAERAMLWQLSWWADPLFLASHDYPVEMRSAVGDRLPTFTPEQSAALLTSVPDFFGFNHYTSFYAYDQTNSTDPFLRDQSSGMTHRDPSGNLIGAPAASSWLYVVPRGFPMVLQWITQRYSSNVPIIVTENGVDIPGESEIPLPAVLNDTFRVDYLSQYLGNFTQVAIGELGLPVLGYFIWSFLDNFEWADGFQKRFGLHYVDYTSPTAKRYKKTSVDWYTNWIKEQQAITAKAEEQKQKQKQTKHEHEHKHKHEEHDIKSDKRHHEHEDHKHRIVLTEQL